MEVVLSMLITTVIVIIVVFIILPIDKAILCNLIFIAVMAIALIIPAVVDKIVNKTELTRRHTIKFLRNSCRSAAIITSSVHNICNDMGITMVKVHISPIISDHCKIVVKCTKKEFRTFAYKFILVNGQTIHSIKY